MKTLIFYSWISATFLLISCAETTPSADVNTETHCLPQKIKADIELNTLSVQPITEFLTLNGKVEYNDNRTVPYHSLVEGVITQIYFKLGDFVKEGQIVAEIKSTTLNEMHDQLEGVQLQLKVAKRQYESTLSMFEDGLSSQKELLESQSDYESLQSNLKALQNNLRLLGNDKSGSTFKIKAPTSGYIIQKDINAGMNVSASDTPLFTIADLSEVWINANIYTTNLRYIQPHQKVQIKTLAYPNLLFEGEINEIAQVFSEEERVLKARIILDNPEKLLKPGMAADVLVALEEKGKNALAIPNSALIFDNNQNYVIRYRNDCEQEIIWIPIASRNESFTYLPQDYSGTLKEGDQVVTKHELLLYEELINRRD